jgi:ferredoxin
VLFYRLAIYHLAGRDEKMNWISKLLTKSETTTAVSIPLGRVVSDGARCVQCGTCGYNCPMGIPVRDYAREGKMVIDDRCISCGQCIAVCPRGTLRWETIR